jgi:hypothetical protein
MGHLLPKYQGTQPPSNRESNNFTKLSRLIFLFTMGFVKLSQMRLRSFVFGDVLPGNLRVFAYVSEERTASSFSTARPKPSHNATMKM